MVKTNFLGTAAHVGIAALIVAAIFPFLALHVFSTESLRNLTLDLTEDEVYTLSDGTKEVLAAIREPVDPCGCSYPMT